MTPELTIVIILASLVGSAFASGSETALVSASRLRLRHYLAEGRRGAALALALVADRERVLAATLIVNNIVNIGGAAVATALLIRWMGSEGSIVATAVMTSLYLLFGEIVPKAYSRQHADRMLVNAAPIWRVLSWLIVPITYPGELVMRKFFRVIKRTPRSLFVSREEIRLILEESAEGGRIREHEHEMLESALVFSETVAREIMVPISELALLPEASGTGELLDLVRARGHTRIPVYRERVDRIIGLVNVFDILYDTERRPTIREYVRPVRLVPDSKRIDRLFLEMQKEQESLVVVVDEFGACIGIVSIEDIIEEIFGELADEHEDATPEIQELAPGWYRVSARVDIEDLNRETGWDLAKTVYQTIGGYVLHHLGRIPARGEEFTDRWLHVKVLEADRYGVKQLELRDQTVAERKGRSRTIRRGRGRPAAS